jgi:hypothetical protein
MEMAAATSSSAPATGGVIETFATMHSFEGSCRGRIAERGRRPHGFTDSRARPCHRFAMRALISWSWEERRRPVSTWMAAAHSASRQATSIATASGTCSSEARGARPPPSRDGIRDAYGTFDAPIRSRPSRRRTPPDRSRPRHPPGRRRAEPGSPVLVRRVHGVRAGLADAGRSRQRPVAVGGTPRRRERHRSAISGARAGRKRWGVRRVGGHARRGP